MTDPSTPLAAIVPVTVVSSPHENPTINPQDQKQKAVGIPLAVVSDGAKLVDLKPFFDAYRTRPEVRRGTVNIFDRVSFIEFINRYKSADTVLFCDLTSENLRLVAIMNYHPSGGDITATGACDFRVELKNAAIVLNQDTVEPLVKHISVPVFFGEIP